jgi:Zn-dependent protease with chaperone function
LILLKVLANRSQIKNNFLPPWLWFWLLLFVVLIVPYYIDVWKINIYGLIASPVTQLDSVTNAIYRLLGIVGLLELVPSLALFAGILALLLPRVRANFLEKRYSLAPVNSTSLSVVEIIDFVHAYAPDIKIRINQRRFDQAPFIYPLGFRKTAIAIFGQIIVLWRADREAAETILLHELAHHHHGDALIIGAGSPFRAVIEQWGRLYFWLFLLPFTLSFAGITLLFFWEINQLKSTGGLSMDFWVQAIIHKLNQSIFMMGGLLTTSICLLIWTASIFVVPMAAIWCSEFNADQASASFSRSNTLNTLKKFPENTRGLQWIFHRLAHPPEQFRQWIIAVTGKRFGQVILLVLFPLAFGIQAALLKSLELIVAFTQGGYIVPINRVAGLNTMSGIWFSAAVVIAIWPWISSKWENLFCSIGNSSYLLAPQSYWISAGVLVTLSALVFQSAL